MEYEGKTMYNNRSDYKKMSFRQSLSRNLSLFLRFPLKSCGNDIRNLNLFPNMLLTLILLILFLSTNFAQTKSLYYQSFASLSDSTSNDSLVVEDVPIPSINAGDIVGQVLVSPISGIVFALIGGLVGSVIEPPDGYPTEAIAIGAFVGYTVGSAVGVYAVARKDKYDSNLGILIGSSILGELTGILLYSISNSNIPNTSVFAFAPLVLPPVFAIITLNAFQQKKSNITVGFDVQQLPQPNAYCYGMKLQYEF